MSVIFYEAEELGKAICGHCSTMMPFTQFRKVHAEFCDTMKDDGPEQIKAFFAHGCRYEGSRNPLVHSIKGAACYSVKNSEAFSKRYNEPCDPVSEWDLVQFFLSKNIMTLERYASEATKKHSITGYGIGLNSSAGSFDYNANLFDSSLDTVLALRWLLGLRKRQGFADESEIKSLCGSVAYQQNQVAELRQREALLMEWIERLGGIRRDQNGRVKTSKKPRELGRVG